MSNVLQNIRPELLNKSSRYRCKLIKAAVNGYDQNSLHNLIIELQMVHQYNKRILH